MYPTLSDLLKDLFGLYLPLPVQTFGLFVGIAFLVAMWLGGLELGRKNKSGLLSEIKQKVKTGEKPAFSNLWFSALAGLLAGYKIVFLFLNYSDFAADPQSMILSSKGSLPGAFLAAIFFSYLKYRDLKKNELPSPVWRDLIMTPTDLMGNIVFISAICGLLGAKIFHNLENPAEFIDDPMGALLSFSGLTMYGGLILATLGIYIYCRRCKISFWVVADALAPTVMIAYAIGRVGCHLSGDGDWGIVNHYPAPSFLPSWLWSFDYPHNVINEGIRIPGCLGRHCFHLPEPVFPTPLYESIICSILFIVLWSFRKKWKKTGLMFGAYLVMNGTERFFIELIRVNERYHLGNFSFTQAELIAVLLVITGLLIIRKSLKSKFEPLHVNPQS